MQPPAHEPAPDREPLSGTVERVTYHNPDNGYAVLRVKIRGHRDLVTVIGHAPTVAPGEYLQASGRWEVHREHGQQFRASLAMLGKLGIAPIDPGSTFLKGATGPLAGARLLFGGACDANLSERDLEARLVGFGQETGLGAQVLEDAVCNWQKSPSAYVRFRG